MNLLINIQSKFLNFTLKGDTAEAFKITGIPAGVSRRPFSALTLEDHFLGL
nr:hypothetical protein [uncultured Cohaesibacter sp.]